MQIKRRTTNWNDNFDQDALILEPTNKRQRYPLKPIKRNPAMDQCTSWGFDSTQSTHMMNIVSSQLGSRLIELQKELMDLEWAKGLREGEAHDSRKEYLQQFASYWAGKESEITQKVAALIDDIIFWGNQLVKAKQDNIGYEIGDIIQDFENKALELLEDSNRLQSALEFVKNDKGSLKEAMRKIDALRIDASRD